MINERSNDDVQYETFSYRHADEILNSNLSVKNEILHVINATAAYWHSKVKKVLRRNCRRHFERRAGAAKFQLLRASCIRSILIFLRIESLLKSSFPDTNLFIGISSASLPLTTKTRLMSAS